MHSVSRKALLDRSRNRGEPTDHAFRSFVDGLVRLSARMQALRSRLARHMKLSPPQYGIAMALAHEPRGMRVVDVAARLELSVTFVTTQIGRMERSGLVRRNANPQDRRSSIIRLSPKGREILARGAAFQRSVNDRLFASLTRSDMLRLTKVLSCIAADAEATLAATSEKRPRRRG